MRIAVVNPNIAKASTESFVALAERSASPGTEIIGATGRFGVDLMRRPAELAIGVHAMLDAAAAIDPPPDAIVIAAFGDYGADAAADLFGCPVMTLADAAFASLRLSRARYAMLLPAPGFADLMRPLPARHGATDGMAGMREVAAAPGSTDYADAAEAALGRLIAESDPGTVLLVGPPLAACAERLRASTSVPLVEGVGCAVALCEALLRLGITGRPEAPGGKAPHSMGLSAPLAALLERRTS